MLAPSLSKGEDRDLILSGTKAHRQRKMAWRENFMEFNTTLTHRRVGVVHFLSTLCFFKDNPQLGRSNNHSSLKIDERTVLILPSCITEHFEDSLLR